jgi:hypothetical protein
VSEQATADSSSKGSSATGLTPPDLLFGQLFDDAALFPPRNASISDAVSGHLSWMRSPHAPLVGPFVCSDAQWDQVRRQLPEGAQLRLALTVPRGVATLQALLVELAKQFAVTVKFVEVPAPALQALPEAIAVLRDIVPATTTTFVELPVADVGDKTCELLAANDLNLKLRTGGVVAEAFPPDSDLASAIVHAVHHGLPFKLTAGLHGAVRRRDPITGFEHHGFLNVMAATATAAAGGDVSAVAAALGVRSKEAVVGSIRQLDESTCLAVRRQFRSFGTCSIDEPIDELKELGLLATETE